MDIIKVLSGIGDVGSADNLRHPTQYLIDLVRQGRTPRNGQKHDHRCHCLRAANTKPVVAVFLDPPGSPIGPVGSYTVVPNPSITRQPRAKVALAGFFTCTQGGIKNLKLKNRSRSRSQMSIID